jgi:DNA-binding NarL/FixJ family response regulator
MRVLVVDDHAMMRQGLRSVLEAYNDVEVIGEAADGVEAVNEVDRLRPRVVLMDVNMPRMNGIEATTRITSRRPDSIVIGLTINTEQHIHEAMSKAGARGLLNKEIAVDHLYDVIIRAMSKGDVASETDQAAFFN